MGRAKRERVRVVKATVGANVRRARIRRGLTQAELAELAELDPRTVQRLEAGDVAGLPSIVVVADALGVSVASLFRAAQPPARPPGRPKGR
jgi:transcriptional regulator with XRE-family HTH domain